MTLDQKKCFIIMPFSGTSEKHTTEHWTKHFTFLKQLIQSFGSIEVTRSEPLRGDIVKGIIEDLVNSDIVVADITDANPNVYWELGVRLSKRYGTITIAEVGTKPSFNISTKGIIPYNPENIYQNEEFRDMLKKAILDCIENPNESDSIVLDAISGREFNPLPPQIAYNVLPVYLENKKPRTRFTLTNLSHQPAKVRIKVKAYLGKNFMKIIEAPYYSGETPWNVNPNDNVRGNFALENKWIESNKKLTLEFHVTIFDINDRAHQRLPTCYTYVRDRNVWNYEPTSFNELKKFKV